MDSDIIQSYNDQLHVAANPFLLQNSAIENNYFPMGNIEYFDNTYFPHSENFGLMVNTESGTGNTNLSNDNIMDLQTGILPYYFFSVLNPI